MKGTYSACTKGNQEALEYLISKGAEVDLDGKKFLHIYLFLKFILILKI